MATVYTAMKKCLDMTNEAGQEHAIQTFDQQLYAIAQQVKWSKPDIFKFFANQHKLSCVSSIHARINQKITKTAIGPKFPYRR
jgi:Tfp pilus assembly ATPase PilU